MKTMASDVLYGVPKEATYEETIGAQGRFGNLHLVALYHTQLKTRTRIAGEPLHQFTRLTMPFLCYTRSKFSGEQARHALTT